MPIVERMSLGTITARVRAQGPIGVVVTAPVVAVHYDDGVWDVECPRHEEVLRWTLEGAPPSVAVELTELVDPNQWMTFGGLGTYRLRLELDRVTMEAAERELAAWLAAASSSEAAVHDHTRDVREGAAE